MSGQEIGVVLRELVGFLFIITAAAFGLLAWYQARSERISAGSWRPRARLGWWLAGLFAMLAVSYLYPGLESVAAAEPLDGGRGFFALLVTILAVAVWLAWVKGNGDA